MSRSQGPNPPQAPQQQWRQPGENEPVTQPSRQHPLGAPRQPIPAAPQEGYAAHNPPQMGYPPQQGYQQQPAYPPQQAQQAYQPQQAYQQPAQQPPHQQAGYGYANPPQQPAYQQTPQNYAAPAAEQWSQLQPVAQPPTQRPAPVSQRQPQQQPLPPENDPYAALASQLTPPTGAPTHRPATATPAMETTGRRAPSFGAPQPAPQVQPAYADPSAYDLGGYAVPNDPRQPAVQHGHQQDPRWLPDASAYQAPQHGGQAQHAPLHQPAAQQFQSQYGQQPSLGAAPPQLGDDYRNGPRTDHGYADQDAADDVEYETEPPRRSRKWLIAGTLVASIAIGGGMAYGYKTIFSPKSGTQSAQVVKAGTTPARTAPDNPGGKKFANTDSQLMNKPDGNLAGDDNNGVKKVQVVTVGADRNVMASPPTSSGVPGLTMVAPSGAGGLPSGITPSMATPQAPPVRQPVQPQAVGGGIPKVAAPTVVTQAPAAVQRVAKGPVPSVLDGEPVAPAAKAPPKQPVVKKAPANDAFGSSAPTNAAAALVPGERSAVGGPAPAPAKRAGGFVAVLGYQGSQVEALQMLADMQQKYGAQLGDKKLSVVEADRSDKGLGTIYRVVVGAPGGAGAAKGICDSVAQAGHKGCYVN